MVEELWGDLEGAEGTMAPDTAVGAEDDRRLRQMTETAQPERGYSAQERDVEWMVGQFLVGAPAVVRAEPKAIDHSPD